MSRYFADLKGSMELTYGHDHVIGNWYEIRDIRKQCGEDLVESVDEVFDGVIIEGRKGFKYNKLDFIKRVSDFLGNEHEHIKQLKDDIEI
tara:strand:+ start:260 stop:529 length:270 start_codon:yes stop_codon:yes gene_type:complete